MQTNNIIIRIEYNVIYVKYNIYHRYIGETNPERRRQSRICPPNSLPTPNPIITVTEHTPTPSPDYMKRHVYIFIIFYFMYAFFNLIHF